MKVFEFTVILKGMDVMSEETAERLHEAGCDDCTPGSSDGVAFAAFDREAASLESAIASALRDVRRAGCEVDRVYLDEAELTEIAETASA
jgi:hypothetical protein